MHKPSHFNPKRLVWENETLAHSKWNYWNQMFYSQNDNKRTKIIPSNSCLEKYLTPRAIAYWFMDDGSLLANNSKGLVFHTQNFDESDVKRLANFLEQKYGLKTWVKQNKKKTYHCYIR